MANATSRELPNFLPSFGKNKDGVAMRGVMKDQGQTILLYFFIEDQLSIAFWNGTSDPDIHFVEDLWPSGTPLLPSQNPG